MGSADNDEFHVPVRNEARMTVNRTVYSLPSFEAAYKTLNSRSRKFSRVREKVVRNCNADGIKKTVGSHIPITRWLPQYKLRQWLISDIIVGITVAIFQVPQSMGYALIAHVPPVYGLYTSLFPAFMYSLLGTSRHSAFGAFAIVSGVMTGNVVADLLANQGYSLSDIEKGKAGPDAFQPIEIATAVGMTIGVYTLVLGLIRLGIVSIYLSEQLISGFATAASFYVFTSQIRYIFGVHLPYNSGMLAIIRTYIDLFKSYKEINWVAVLISAICIVVLLFFKIYVNEKLKEKGFKLPFPIELLAVIGGTLASHFLQLHANYNVQVVGDIPKGLPSFKLPRFEIINLIWLKAIPIAAVGYCLSLTVAKLSAENNHYEVDANQELVAMGAANCVSSCFSCLPCSASLPRSAIQEQAGGKTQLVSLVNCAMMLSVLFIFAPLLKELPNCVLASVIAVALKTLLGKIQEFKRYWTVSKLDGTMWMLAFAGVIILDVDVGLCVGVLFSLLVLIYKTSRPKTSILGSVGGVDIYVPLKKYPNAREMEAIKIYQFCGPIHFANRDYFRKDLLKKTKDFTTIVPVTITNVHGDENHNCASYDNGAFEGGRQPTAIVQRHLIIDFSMVSYVDTAAITTLRKIIQEFHDIGVELFMAACVPHVVHVLERDKFFMDFSKHNLFVTVHDAVACAVAQRKARLSIFMTDPDHDNTIHSGTFDNRFF